MAKAPEGCHFIMEQPTGGVNLYMAKTSEGCQFVMEQPLAGVNLCMAKASEGANFNGTVSRVSIFI